MNVQKNIIEIEDIRKVYKGFLNRKKNTALNGISFIVNEGEIFGLLGPNGSGKTTTLKLLLGLVFPTEGKIWVFSKKPSNIAVKNRIGFLPEESYLYRFLTAQESLSFYADFFGMNKSAKTERIDELLRMVGLENDRNRPVGEFSKGMARRLGLAQALINDPDLLLLDEPTSGLDPIGCREVKDLILGLREKGKTIVLCSHLLADVEDVCDRIAILNKGDMVVSGDMKDLLVDNDRLRVICRTGERTDKDLIMNVLAEKNIEVLDCMQERDRLEDLFVKLIKG